MKVWETRQKEPTFSVTSCSTYFKVQPIVKVHLHDSKQKLIITLIIGVYLKTVLFETNLFLWQRESGLYQKDAN